MKVINRLIVGIALSCLASLANAQIAKWLVRPSYDLIELTDNGLLQVVSGGKVGLLSIDGKEVLPMQFDSIGSFKEDRALLFKDGAFCGITDFNGRVIPLQEKGYILPHGTSRFNYGYLLVKRNSHFYFLDKEGNQAYGPFADAYPFFDGHACVRAYVDYQKKPEETVYDCIDTGGNPLLLNKLDKGDVNFMSSFNNGKAVIVIKKRFYVVDSETYRLTPISTDSTMNKKSLVVSGSKEIQWEKTEGGYIITAKNGKFLFDQFMRLKLMELLGNEPVIMESPVTLKRKYTSEFDEIVEGSHSGLTFDGDTILPPQFDDVVHMENNLAIIRTNGKYGVITVDEENDFFFKLNNNENIGFNHQFYDAKLTVLMPSYIKCASSAINSHSTDCEIQIESRTESENVEGNTLGYNCRLSIPGNLTDTLTTHDYFYSLKYDGLLSVPHKVTVSEWYVKYYEVELSNTNFTVSSINDTITVEFDLIKTDVARNDESNYFKNIEVVASNFSEQPILSKITENHYSFQIFGIDRERINFSVKITEVGCPSIEYPFEMVFVKPSPREKNKKTTVKIASVRKTTPEVILVDD